MILAYNEVYECLCMWYYDDNMQLMYWDDQYSDAENNLDLESELSVFGSLENVREITLWEILYDSGDL